MSIKTYKASEQVQMYLNSVAVKGKLGNQKYTGYLLWQAQ